MSYGRFCNSRWTGLFKIFVVINQKLCDVYGQKIVWVVGTIGTINTPSFVQIQEVTQNSFLI